MPTYAYLCKVCSYSFDLYQAFTDPAVTECPECNGPVRKQFGAVGVVFKGSGFYKTDSRSSSSASVSASDSSSGSKADKSDAASASTKSSESSTKSSSGDSASKSSSSTASTTAS